MAERPQPNVWVRWRLDRVPSGTTVYLWGTRPFADQDSFKEPRLLRVSNILRECSTDAGEPRAPSCDVDVDDADGIVRGILADVATRHGIGGELAVQILSEESRKDGGTASDLLRGRVTKVVPTAGRRARVSVSGQVAGLFVETNLQKTYPQLRIGDEHPYAPQESVGLVYPIVIGLRTDVGAVDANGNSAEKGVQPAIDVGTVLLLANGTEVDQDDYPLQRLAVPTGLSATVNGTAGTQEVRYDVTALNDWGETTAATVTITNGPDLLNGTDSVSLNWADVSGALNYHVYRNQKRIALTTTSDYTDVGVDDTGQEPPDGNTAFVDVTTPSGVASPWARFVAAQKSVTVVYVYGSDLADGVAPQRARVDGTDGDLLIFGDAGYPHANPYVDMTRSDGTVIRQTVFYMRGPRVKHHRERTVTIAWNGYGVEDVGDGSGDVITQAFSALEWLLNEEVLKDGGLGHQTGNYGPAEQFDNGVAILRSSQFTAAQALSAEFMGDSTGYVVNLSLTEPTTLRAILRRFHTTFGSLECPANRLGQYYPILIDDRALSAGGRTYRDRENIIRWMSDDYAHDDVETRVVFNGGWDNDAQQPRFESVSIEYDHADYGHAEPKQGAAREAPYSDDLPTLMDAQDRYLRRHLLAPRTVRYVTDLGGLDDDLGASIYLTHYEGSSSAAGDVNLRAMVIGHEIDVSPGLEAVTHRVLDLTRIVTGFQYVDDALAVQTSEASVVQVSVAASDSVGIRLDEDPYLGGDIANPSASDSLKVAASEVSSLSTTTP